MKFLRYLMAFAIATSMLVSCVEEPIGPLRDGEDEDDILPINPPPPNPPK